tara:strand:+ start:388 stop:543 length:156 start_codon:yes stop_codon:yes gene_type:complete
MKTKGPTTYKDGTLNGHGVKFGKKGPYGVKTKKMKMSAGGMTKKTKMGRGK